MRGRSSPASFRFMRRAGITVYWIVNLSGGVTSGSAMVELYSGDPAPATVPNIRSRVDMRSGD